VSETFLRYLKTLVRTERATPADLSRFQHVLIEKLVRHAHSEVPYYRDRLGCLINKDNTVDLSRWHEVPILDRENANNNSQALRAKELSKSYGSVHESWTTGTSGQPLKFTTNGLARVAYNAAFTRFARSFGADFSLPLAHIRVFRGEEKAEYPEGLAWKSWSMLEPDADSFGLDLRTPVRQQIEWLLSKRCPYLSTSPSNAMAIAYAATRAEADQLGLNLVFSIGETVVPGTRELIAEKLGARLIAAYSCEEIGYIATECPVTPHYHITHENTLVEIVDARGLQVAPGETGRVLVTGLYNYSTPFIRYDVGDMAVLSGKPCPCGRTLPVISEVIGRTRNAFIFKDGARAWPRVWDARAMEALAPCQGFQIVQTDYDSIEFRYVPDGSARRPDVAGLNAYAHEHFHPSISVVAVAVDAITRVRGGKHEPFISLLAEAQSGLVNNRVSLDAATPRPKNATVQ
jgi:phenylacetate-CoA ligase